MVKCSTYEDQRHRNFCHRSCCSVHGMTDILSNVDQSCVYLWQVSITVPAVQQFDKLISRDVKTVYFLKLVTGLPKPFFTGYRKAYCERDNCHQSLHACYQSITCCFTAAVAHIPDARTPLQRDKGQWRIKAVGAEGTDVYAAMS